MSLDSYVADRNAVPQVSLAGLRFAILSTRNFVFLVAILAMNFTLFRPSPVDLLFVLAFLITLVHIALQDRIEVSRRALLLSLLAASWLGSSVIASLPHIADGAVVFELISKTFAIAIAIIGAFVSMTWNRRHFETFMKVYIVSSLIATMLGTIGFLTQHPLLTWDGRAKGLIDDPNMYGTFLIPAAVFCVYYLPRTRYKLVVTAALGIVMLGILLSFSRIAVVGAMVCLFAYMAFQNRKNPRRLVLIAGGLVAIALVLLGIASVTSAEFTAKLLDRLTLAKSYDLGEEGRYHRYLLVIPMILQNPIGIGVLQLEKIFPEPIHNVWLSSFVNYGWTGGIAWISLVVGSVFVTIRNYRRTRNEITLALLFSLIGVILGATLHEGEHWRQMWLMFGLIWGFTGSRPGLTEPPPSPRATRGHARPAHMRRRATASQRPVTARRKPQPIPGQIGPAR